MNPLRFLVCGLLMAVFQVGFANADEPSVAPVLSANVSQATEVPVGTLEFILTLPEPIQDSFEFPSKEIGMSIAECSLPRGWRIALDTPLCAAFGADTEYTSVQKNIWCGGREWVARRTLLFGEDGLLFNRWEFSLPYTDDSENNISIDDAHGYAAMLYMHMLGGCVYSEPDLGDNIDFPWHGWRGHGTYTDYLGVQVRFRWQYRAVAITYLSPAAAERWDLLESLGPVVEPKEEEVGLLLPH